LVCQASRPRTGLWASRPPAVLSHGARLPPRALPTVGGTGGGAVGDPRAARPPAHAISTSTAGRHRRSVYRGAIGLTSLPRWAGACSGLRQRPSESGGVPRCRVGQVAHTACLQTPHAWRASRALARGPCLPSGRTCRVGCEDTRQGEPEGVRQATKNLYPFLHTARGPVGVCPPESRGTWVEWRQDGARPWRRAHRQDLITRIV
jgi:hypothetical protein